MDPGAIVTVIELCFKAGSKVVEACNTWKNAESELRERITIVELCWVRSRTQVEFLMQIAETISHELRRLLDDLLNQLVLRLSAATKQIYEVVRQESQPRIGFWRFGSQVNKTAYIMKKDALDGVIKDLEAWERRFDPSWFLLMKIQSPTIDDALRRTKASAGAGSALKRGRAPLALASGLRDAISPSPREQAIFLPADSIEIVDIPYSSARQGRRRAGDTRWYVIDTIESRPGGSVTALDRDVRKLANKLARADPLAFGLLQCKGVLRVMEPPPSRNVQAFNLILRVPENMQTLQSLRHLLLGSDDHISLTRKFRIARELARSVASVHTFSFVHKNIRPESILCFEDLASAKSHAFLVGFDAFRSADGATLLQGDMAWDRNVYRHPLRQGEFPSEAYRMEHDIYSLGVCLLEIGLWESFVDYPGQVSVGSKPNSGHQRFQAWLQEKKSEPSQALSRAPGFLEAVAFRLKDYLEELAREKLPSRMGDRYTNIVLRCLTCLDGDLNAVDRLTYEGIDDDGILVACRFIESIMLDLEDIAV